jgi:hypothetical protein
MASVDETFVYKICDSLCAVDETLSLSLERLYDLLEDQSSVFPDLERRFDVHSIGEDGYIEWYAEEAIEIISIAVQREKETMLRDICVCLTF